MNSQIAVLELSDSDIHKLGLNFIFLDLVQLSMCVYGVYAPCSKHFSMSTSIRMPPFSQAFW